MSELLTDEEVAALLDCEASTVQELVRTNKLPAAKFGRSWRFHRDTLMEAIKQKTMENMIAPAPRLLNQQKPAQLRKIEVKLPPVLPRLGQS